jgi:hypothetical protein
MTLTATPRHARGEVRVERRLQTGKQAQGNLWAADFWAAFKPPLGIFSQTVGPICKVWANPVRGPP